MPKKFLQDNPEIAAEIEKKVLELSVTSNRLEFGVEEDSEDE